MARLWERGERLYAGAWVDRPQGLLLVFRAMLHVDGGSAGAMRVVAAAVAALVALATLLVCLRMAGRIPATVAVLLAATVGASPLIESFTLSGELLASLPATLSLLAFLAYLERRRVALLALAGLLTGCAVMIKQSGFDAGLAALLFLVVRERRAALRPAAVLVACAALPVALGALLAPSFSDWWYALVTYRGQADSLLSGSLQHRAYLLGRSLPHAVLALAPLGVLAAYGFRRAPLLARLWLPCAALGVIGGGNFHYHYYIQLVPPLAVLAGVGAASALRRADRVAGVAFACTALGALAVTAPLWFDSPAAQAEGVWRDAHLPKDAALARYVDAHTRPGQRIFVLWAAADVYYLADREPALRYMWYRNIQKVPGALGAAQRMLAARRAALVLAVHTPEMIDKSGRTARILRREYRVVAHVAGVPLYAPRQPA